ncbi:MAG: methylated-DNA--[Clostridia bacterium]|nr:methylated-DNA--[protein]-cysteine S-methyltransferase [Clostridia bacterium]
MIYTRRYFSPLGGITLAGDGNAMTGLWFDGQKGRAGTLSGGYSERNLPVFDEACRWLDIYFSGKVPDFTPALAMRTTAFRKAVWEILLTIPYGRTITYGQIAKRIADQAGVHRMSAQAVGGAVGHNAIALIIPCHRVIGADGSLTGYAAGMDRKLRLLRMEGTDVSTFYIP